MSIRIGIGLDVFGAGIDADAATIYNRIIADGGVSNLTRLNFFVKGLKTIYGSLTNVPVCYDAHWIGYKLGSGTGATAGQAAAILYSLTVAGDAVQATAASQPLLLSHNGASTDNYWWGSGVSGNYVSTPSLSSVASTKLEITAQILGGNATSSRTIFSQDSLSLEGRVFGLEWSNATTGTIGFFYNTSFSGYQISSVGVGNIANYVGYIKASYDSNGVNATIIFYSSTNGTTWTQLSTHTVVSARLGNGSGSIQVGANSAANLYIGKIGVCTASNTISATPLTSNATPTIIFNPATYNASTSQTQWTSSTGEVWTINTGTAATGYKGVLVNRTIAQGDGVDDTLSSTYQANQYITQFLALNQFALVNKYYTMSGVSLNHLQYNNGSGMKTYNLGNAIVNSASFNNRMDLYDVDFAVAGKVHTNNTAEVTGNLTAVTPTAGLSLFSGGAVYANCIISTFLKTASVVDATTRTATYNLIRSLNNNAF
jgi:hypothetical protein